MDKEKAKKDFDKIKSGWKKKGVKFREEEVEKLNAIASEQIKSDFKEPVRIAITGSLEKEIRKLSEKMDFWRSIHRELSPGIIKALVSVKASKSNKNVWTLIAEHYPQTIGNVWHLRREVKGMWLERNGC